jgi:hypothetical protein
MGTLTHELGWPCASDGDAPARPSAAGVPLGTRWPVSYGHLRCRGSSTCVLDPAHCERLDSRLDNSSVPDCGATPPGLRSNLADHRPEEKKIFCRVTTRRRKIHVLNGLGRDLSSLAALSLRLGMARSSRGVLAMCGLAPRRLPTTDFPLTVRVVTVTLVPTRWQILTITPLAQARTQSRSTRSRRAPASYFNLMGAHGSCNSQGKSPRRMNHILLGR